MGQSQVWLGLISPACGAQRGSKAGWDKAETIRWDLALGMDHDIFVHSSLLHHVVWLVVRQLGWEINCRMCVRVCPFQLETDTSSYATGAVLSQLCDNSKWHLVGFTSKGLDAAERNYEVHDKELLSVI